jgi:hypothetical protein
VRLEKVKVLYARVLAPQSLVDGRLDPREIEYRRTSAGVPRGLSSLQKGLCSTSKPYSTER